MHFYVCMSNYFISRSSMCSYVCVCTHVYNTVFNVFQVMKWSNYGLPSDRLSLENAIFVTKARKWPLLIDPQGQALK